jgi:Skp family chaperone for outer membrane proteins
MSRSWIKVALVSLGLASVPALAFAGDRQEAPVEAGVKADGKREAKFPMKSETFMEKVDARLEKLKGRITEGLEKRDVPEEKRAKVLAKFEEGATKIREAARTAGADGTVTAEEAKEVRAVAKDVRKDMKKAAGGEGKGKGKGKGKGTGKDKDAGTPATR